MKVRRLRTDCCGMKVGTVYEVLNSGEPSYIHCYVNCRLPDGKESGDHWAGFDTKDPFFEVVEA